MIKLHRLLPILLVAAMLLVSCTGPQAPDAVETTQQTEGATESSAPQSPVTPPKEPIDPPTDTGEYLTLSEEELYDRMLGGWLGQMIGVSWSASTEFDYRHELMPLSEMPLWSAELINNAYSQDDLYVEIPFVDAMAQHGAFCDVSYMAENFKNTTFKLWHANLQGRNNLQAGVPYPESGLYGIHSDDIDWQIESDFLGMMYPGLVSEAAARSFEIGHIMNYGDGVYGGVFVAAMHAAAYSADSIEEIAEAGIAVIPKNTKFRTLMDEVMASYRAGDSFEVNWQKVEDKWGHDQICGHGGLTNIDAKLNASYILLGLLYGKGDLRQTVIYATRCGQDSDCNPSSAASILGNYLGASGLDRFYTAKIDMTGRSFAHTEYSLQEVLDACKRLCGDILRAYGATLTDGEWRIPLSGRYETVPYEQYGDVFRVYVLMTDYGGCTLRMSMLKAGFEELKSFKLEMGDGTVFNSVPDSYTYDRAGTYTVRYTATGTKGSTWTDSLTVTLANTPPQLLGTPICSENAPNGGGSKDLGTICDGKVPIVGYDATDTQYDTFHRGKVADFAYAGLTFAQEQTVATVIFVEGVHFYNGGWFAETPYVELLIGGTWTRVQATLSRKYPIGDQSAHGASYESFVFTLQTPTACRGVRIAGKPGGSATFISIGEITAYGVTK